MTRLWQCAPSAFLTLLLFIAAPMPGAAQLIDGLGGARPPGAATPTQRPPAPQPQPPASVDDPGGAWIVTWEDWPRRGERRTGWLTLARPQKVECVAQMDGHCAYRRREDAVATPNLFGNVQASNGAVTAYHRPNAITVTQDAISVHHAYGVLGNWGGKAELRRTGRDRFEGRWTYGDSNGREVWIRARPEITKVIGRSRVESEVAPGSPVKVKVPWSGPGNEMRGNRPTFTLELVGRNLWGAPEFDAAQAPGIEPSRGFQHVSRPGASGGPAETISGVAWSLVVWSQARPGLQRVRVAGVELEIDLELEGYPEPALTFIGEGERRLERLQPGAAFQVVAQFPTSDRHRQRVIAKLTPSAGSPVDVELWPHDGASFRSRRLALAPNGAAVASFAPPTAIAKATARRLYTGNWTVGYQGYDAARTPGTGEAEIFSEGAEGALKLAAPATVAGVWQLLEAQWTDTVSLLRFGKAGVAPPPGAAHVQLAPGAAVLVATGEGLKPATAPLDRVAELFARGWTMRASLRVQDDGRLTGDFIREDAAATLGFDVLGRMTWSRSPSVEVTVEAPLSDQRPPHAYLVGYRGAVAGVAPERHIIVAGRHLPVGAGDARRLESRDAKVRYIHERELKRDDPLLARLDPPLDLGDGRSAMLLRAVLAPDTALGWKQFTVNGLMGAWRLDNPYTPARLAWVQPGGAPRLADDNSRGPIDRALGIEQVQVVVELSAPILAPALGIALLRDGAPLLTPAPVEMPRVVQAMRMPDEQGGLVYRTAPLQLALGAPAGGEIPVVADNRLGALPLDATVRAIPARVDLRIEPVEQPGAAWRAALERVARCKSDPLPIADAAAFARAESAEVSRTIFTELARRRLSLKKGDHAAALLMRDGVGAELGRLEPVYRAIGTGSDALVKGFRAEAERNGAAEPFWRTMRVGVPTGSGSVLAGDTLNLQRRLGVAGAERGRYFGMALPEAEEWAVRGTRTAAREFADQLAQASGALLAVDPCDAGKLIALTAHRAPTVAARLMPLLVRVEGNGRATPDAVAQSHVASLPTLGDALRALQDYAALDDAYKSMAVALAGGGAAMTLARAATAVGASTTLPTGVAALAEGALNSGAIAAAITADGVDAVWGMEGYREAVAANRAADIARGFSPAYGEGFVDDAEARRANAMLAAAGAIAPAIGAALPAASATRVGLRRLKDQVLESSAAARGRQLAQRDLDLQAFATLSAGQRSDLASWYASQWPMTPEALAKLPSSERRMIENLETWTGARRATPPPMAAAETVPPLYREGSAAMLPRREEASLANQTFRAATRQGDEVVVGLGRHVGSGSFNDVYASTAPLFGRAPEDTLVRISKPDQAVANALDTVGRKALDEVDPNVVRAPKVVGRFDVADATRGRRVIEVVENVGENAHRTLLRQNGRMNAEQAIAYDRATRELNRKGFLLLDGHTGNFSFVRGPKGELQVAIFDPGGIVPVKGRDPNLARRLQARVNSPQPPDDSLGRLVFDRGDDFDPNGLLALTAGDELKEALRVDTEFLTGIDTRAVGMGAEEIKFAPRIGFQQPALRTLFAAEDSEAAYAALRAAERRPQN